MLKIVLAPDPVLKIVCDPLVQVDSHHQKLIKEMFETMYEANGVGLAAPQVGINKRIFVLDIKHMSGYGDTSPMVFMNGVIESGSGSCVDSEGCLSLPEIRINIERFDTITYSYVDENLERCTKEFSGFLATVIQHENDHLDGKLITDYATPSDILKYDKALKLMKSNNVK